jgi:hypothetical protein
MFLFAAESARVAAPPPGERNFDVFHQLVRPRGGYLG